MKTIRNMMVAGALLLALAMPAMAQQYQTTTLKTIAFIAPSIASNNVNEVIGLTKYDQVAIQVSCTMSNPAACWNGQDTTNLVLYFLKSQDGVNYSRSNTPASEFTITVPITTNSAYARETWVTNFSVNSLGYLKLAYVTNQSSIAHATNIVIKYTVKPRRNG